MKELSKRARWMGALLAAFILVVQGFGTAYAQGVGSRFVPIDAFGNPICITSGEHDPADGGPHGTLNDCCALACGGVHSAASPADLTEAQPADARLVAILSGYASSETRLTRRWAAASPRAPPFAM